MNICAVKWFWVNVYNCVENTHLPLEGGGDVLLH